MLRRPTFWVALFALSGCQMDPPGPVADAGVSDAAHSSCPNGQLWDSDKKSCCIPTIGDVIQFFCGSQCGRIFIPGPVNGIPYCDYPGRINCGVCP